MQSSEIKKLDSTELLEQILQSNNRHLVKLLTLTLLEVMQNDKNIMDPKQMFDLIDVVRDDKALAFRVCAQLLY